eukprot:TRINITY_DN10889_c0_g1_i20.p1 TRINITY_DN10889_c0_g1~~TRINITY_DN10889_c0_g1_i20.p1  ORF type:complete len:230 (-),score=30.82 TRINITY_DN10889_c0_g1_i20:323-961(-)
MPMVEQNVPVMEQNVPMDPHGTFSEMLKNMEQMGENDVGELGSMTAHNLFDIQGQGSAVQDHLPAVQNSMTSVQPVPDHMALTSVQPVHDHMALQSTSVQPVHDHMALQSTSVQPVHEPLAESSTNMPSLFVEYKDSSGKCVQLDDETKQHLQTLNNISLENLEDKSSNRLEFINELISKEMGDTEQLISESLRLSNEAIMHLNEEDEFDGL